MSYVRQEPVLVIGTLVSTLVVMLFTYYPGLHLTPAELSSVATISVAATSLITAIFIQPAQLAVIGGAISTILVAASSFGLHLTSEQVAAMTAAVVAILGYIMRGHATAVVNLPH